MFKGIDFKEFMNSRQEWHAFVEGFGDGFCPWGTNYEPSEELKADICKEHHYYTGGSAVGFATLIFSIAGAVRLILGAIL